MTDEKVLIERIQGLPESLKAAVYEFVARLTSDAAGVEANGKTPIRRARKAGSAPGAYHMAPDFDEPLEDFKDYM